MRRAVAGTSEGGKGRGGRGGGTQAMGRRDGDDGMGGGRGDAKMQRAHYNTASDRALAAPPPPKTQQSNYVDPLTLTLKHHNHL